MSDVKNSLIEAKIKEATANDKVMQDFILGILGNEYKTTQFTKAYENAIKNAIKAKEGD